MADENNFKSTQLRNTRCWHGELRQNTEGNKGRTQAIGSFVYSTQSISKLWESGGGGGVVGVTHASKTTTTLLCRADVLRTMGYPLEMKDDYVRSFPIYV